MTEIQEALEEADNALADYIPTIEKSGASLNYGRSVRVKIAQALTLLDGKVLVDEDKLRAILVIGFFASVPDEENRNIHIDKIINDLTTAEEAEND